MESQNFQQKLQQKHTAKEVIKENNHLNKIIINAIMLEQDLYLKLQTIANNNCNP